MREEYTVSFTALRIGSRIDGKCCGNAAENKLCELTASVDSSAEAITEIRRRIRIVAEWKGYIVKEELPDTLAVYDCRVCEWRIYDFTARGV